MNLMKLPGQKLSISLSFTWAAINFTVAPTAVWTLPVSALSTHSLIRAELSNLKELDPDEIDFSGTGRPGQQTAGGTRPFGCPTANTPLILTALVPKEMGLTVSEYPTFLFYVPYDAKDVQSGEFVLQDETGKTELSRTRIALRETPGVISIRLPSQPEYALKIGQTYQWYFRVLCNPQDTDVAARVTGYIRRVALNFAPQDYIAYAKNRIWYDALTDLAERRRRDPQDNTLQNDWAALLGAKDVALESLAKQPLVPCCTPEN